MALSFALPSSLLMPAIVNDLLVLLGGTGNFTFEMDMYEDPKYNVAINQYPVNVIPGQMMYFRVDVKSGDTKLLAFLEECWVTPTANPRDQTRYVIIERG